VYAATGLVILLGAGRPAWRFPLLVRATLEDTFHVINHAVDVGDSDPGWLGPVELGSSGRQAPRHFQD
jgi:hypothetical protein